MPPSEFASKDGGSCLGRLVTRQSLDAGTIAGLIRTVPVSGQERTIRTGQPRRVPDNPRRTAHENRE